MMQKTVVVFLISGLIYAGLGAGFDYADGMDFRFWKFITDAAIFGSLMALLFRYDVRKNERSKNEP